MSFRKNLQEGDVGMVCFIHLLGIIAGNVGKGYLP